MRARARWAGWLAAAVLAGCTPESRQSPRGEARSPAGQSGAAALESSAAARAPEAALPGFAAAPAAEAPAPATPAAPAANADRPAAQSETARRAAGSGAPGGAPAEGSSYGYESRDEREGSDKGEGEPSPPAAPAAGARGRSDARPAPLVQFARASDRLDASLRAADCKTACRSLSSMEEAAGRVCDLASSSRDKDDCTRVQRDLASARARVRAACGACAAAR